MNDFEQYLSHCLDELPASIVRDAMQYSLMAKGKRIRPLLLLKTLQAYDVDEHIGYPAAAAIEMIHTYSLIHDDLPAMDNDTLRRGMPTCHVKFGEDVAILAGDGLLTQAFLQAAKTDCDSDTLVSILRLLSDYSGANGMILGQIKDLEGEADPNADVETLKDIHFYKTGRLLTLPFLCAALLAGRKADLDAWNKIGADIGLSFQIQDDVLDVTSTVEELGKNINSDAENGKTTYVTLLGIHQAQQDAKTIYERALQCLSDIPLKTAQPLLEIFEQLMNRKH